MERWARASYQPNLPLGENGARVTACAQHRQLAREAAAQGMVLLKNEQKLLPLPPGTKAALFGKATFDYVPGGGGSGEVHTAYSRNLYDGLRQKADKLTLFEPLADFYRREVGRQLAEGAVPGLTVEPRLPQDLLEAAARFADVAVVSLCRFSGEGWDRMSVNTAAADPLWDNISTPARLAEKLFEKGDFCLTQGEKTMIEAVSRHFAKVAVVVNAGGAMDTTWFRGAPGIQAVLLAWAGGLEGGLAAADLLVGDVNPSGKLADTLAAALEDYPSTASFHASEAHVDYEEDIYVGYRYFETLARDRVNYPFGFGLSYTTFAVAPGTLQAACGEITVETAVTNTGCRAGKEVVQLYFSAPQGKLGKPARQLAAFAKTALLQPGQTQRLTLRFPLAAMASFDDLGKVCQNAWVLEAGTYHFYLGTDVRRASPLAQTYSCEEDCVLRRMAARLVPTKLPRRMLANGGLEPLPTSGARTAPENFLPPLSPGEMEGFAPAVKARERHLCMRPCKEGAVTLRDVAEGAAGLEAFMAQLTDEELADLVSGQPNTGVALTFGLGNLPEYGVPAIMTADGPAGLRVAPETGVCATAWPCATLLACTWDEALAARVGAAGAREVKENNLGVWLTPAVNLHRSPLCGRNFEYYSEDPLLAGKLGAAMVRGIQSQHIAACPKHLAFNNKETGRKHSDSRVSQRAARELYLRPFEIIVRQAAPWMVMSSYNLVNGCRCAESRELLQEILRDEWGFAGLVTTDWWAHSEQYLELNAGNDLKMGCGYPDRVLKALHAGQLDKVTLRRSARRVLELILKID